MNKDTLKEILLNAAVISTDYNLYLYPKNGHYYIKRGNVKCKDRTTGEWYDAVLCSDDNGQYVIEVNYFNNKFNKVEI